MVIDSLPPPTPQDNTYDSTSDPPASVPDAADTTNCPQEDDGMTETRKGGRSAGRASEGSD